VTRARYATNLGHQEIWWPSFETMPSPHRFPPPWTAELQPNYYVVRDADGQQLAYVYLDCSAKGRLHASIAILNLHKDCSGCTLKGHQSPFTPVTSPSINLLTSPSINLCWGLFLRGRAWATISGEVAQARRSVVERRKSLDERIRAHRKARHAVN